MPRTKISYRTSAKEVYNRFCSVYPDIKISFESWKEIVYTFNYLFRDHILETGDKAKMPWGIGTFSISKKKSKRFIVFEGKEYPNMPIDWPKTLKAGKRIFILNTHTDGYRYKWIWFPKDARFYQSDVWSFKASRITSRKLAEYLKKPNSHYPQLYKEWLRKR